MAEGQTKIDAATPKAQAEASQKKADTVDTNAVEKAVEAGDSAPVKTDAVAKAVASPAQPTPVPVKKAAAKKPAAGKTAKKAARAKKPTAGKVASATASKISKNTPIKQLKETIMATANTANTNDYTDQAKDMAAEMQSRAKAASEKGSEMTQEVVEFQKGNLEALVESSKILASGMQDMTRAYVEEAKTAAGTMQDDVKKFAAVKSPTELFQLQGEIARRNFDAMVSTTSKNTEAMLKLANEAFAPLSSRMSLAADKVRKAA